MADCNSFDELLELRREVMRQWMVNHAEHCGKDITQPFPHEGHCQWPIPPVILSLHPGEVHLLISGAFKG